MMILGKRLQKGNICEPGSFFGAAHVRPGKVLFGIAPHSTYEVSIIYSTVLFQCINRRSVIMRARYVVV